VTASPEIAIDAPTVADPARMHRFDPAMEDVAAAIVLYAVDRVRLDPPPLDGTKTPAQLNTLGPSITKAGLGGTEALRLFCEDLAPATISQDHPRNVSFVPAAPTEAAVLFDLVVGASSIYAGSWMEGSGAVWAENQALRWIADLVGLPKEAGGVFVSGGSAGNLSALVAARYEAQKKWGVRPGRWVIAVSEGAHSSIAAAARVMDCDILKVKTDARGSMRAEHLREALRLARESGMAIGDADRDAGFASDQPAVPNAIVFAVVATSGTTNAGIIDDLPGIAEVCGNEQLWFHVDGAYGGAALAAPSVRVKFYGIECADSFIVDPHKWLFAPYDCAALLYRNPQIAAEAHAQHASYLDVLHDGEWNPSDYAFHLTRRARGLPFWFSLATHGTDAYRDAIESSLALTKQVAKVIKATAHLDLVFEPDLSIVLFRRRGWTSTDYYAWSDRMLREQLTFCVPTSIRNADGEPETLLRFCLTHPRTTLEDLTSILDTLR
jgi:L-2,4-diaminobutyrate decarboxylase